MSWSHFVDWFKVAWEPGDHLTVIAPTGAGKTTLVSGLLNMRRYVLALDPKGGDDTLMSLGYPRLTQWPGERKMESFINKNEDDGQPSRFIVGPLVQRRDERPNLKRVIKETMDGAYGMGGWTVYVDELQIATDLRLMNLRAEAVDMLIAARFKKITFVSSFQGPAWVPSEAMRQPVWCAVSYTRDRDVVARLSEVMGRSRAEMQGAIDALGEEEFTWLIVGRNPREPLRVTRPPKVKAKKVS